LFLENVNDVLQTLPRQDARRKALISQKAQMDLPQVRPCADADGSLERPHTQEKKLNHFDP